MRIVHFSDLHLTALPRDLSALCDKRVLGLTNHFLRRRHRFHADLAERAVARLRLLAPDLVVITGDITSVGSPEDFAAARRCLAPLLAPSSGFACVYVPGNHDAYVRNARCVAALRQAFGVLNNQRWELDQLPAEMTFPGLRVLVVNECVPTAPWLSCGIFTPAVRHRVRAWLETPRQPGERKLLVGHFPSRLHDGRRLPARRRLRDDNLIWNALQAGRLDVSLCGHDHTPFVRRESNGAMEICAGALSATGRLNVLDYSAATGRFVQRWVDVDDNDNQPAATPVDAAAPALSLRLCGSSFPMADLTPEGDRPPPGAALRNDGPPRAS